jgi:F-box and WD-40 domain protein CDC4
MANMDAESEDEFPLLVENMRSGIKYNTLTESSIEPLATHGPSAPLSPHPTSLFDSNQEHPPPRSAPQPIATHSSNAVRSNPEDYAHPKPLPTPGRSASSIPSNLLPSAPASPPTPAPSPGPHSRAPNWIFAGENEVGFLRESTRYFERLDSAQRERFLGELLNMCNNQQLVFVHNFVAPKLKKDPFLHLPNELCLRVGVLSPSSRLSC